MSTDIHTYMYTNTCIISHLSLSHSHLVVATSYIYYLCVNLYLFFHSTRDNAAQRKRKSRSNQSSDSKRQENEANKTRNRLNRLRKSLAKRHRIQIDAVTDEMVTTAQADKSAAAERKNVFICEPKERETAVEMRKKIAAGSRKFYREEKKKSK